MTHRILGVDAVSGPWKQDLLLVDSSDILVFLEAILNIVD